MTLTPVVDHLVVELSRILGSNPDLPHESEGTMAMMMKQRHDVVEAKLHHVIISAPSCHHPIIPQYTIRY